MVGTTRSLPHWPTDTLPSTMFGLRSILKPTQKQALESVYYSCSETPYFFLHGKLISHSLARWSHTCTTQRKDCLSLQGGALAWWGQGMAYTPCKVCSTCWGAQGKCLGWEGPGRMVRSGGSKGGRQAGILGAKAGVFEVLECLASESR